MPPYLRKFGKFTVPDFVGDRYYSKAARLVAVVAAIFVSFTYVAGQMRGVGIVFSRFLEVDINLGVVIGMVLVFFYAVLGGMKGITWTQVAQYCVLIVAYLVPAIFLSLMMTGHVIPQLGLGATLSDGSNIYLLDRLDGLTTELGFDAYTAGTKNMIDMFAITVALMVGTAGLPHVIVRFYTVPKVRDARTSAGWALFFIALLYTTAPAVGAFARTNLVQTVHNKPVAELPSWFENWKETGLLKFEDKNGDGLVQYYNDKTKNESVLKAAEEAGWKGNELTVDRDIMVLANPEIGGLPNWVVALVAAGGLAAALSTAAGLLLVISTSVAHDLIKSVLNPNISEKGELMAARIAAGGAVIIAGYFGIKPPGFVAQVVAFAFGLAASSFFPLIIMGIFNKRMNREGAVAGLITGLVFTAGYIIYFKFMVAADQNVAANWLFGISPEGIGTVGMLLNFIVAYVVSKFTPAPPQEVMDLVESIRYPRGAGGASAH
ncbi:sodium:solute symporter family protein [Leptonema illini]|uniref:sodium:solute symporter family protein n=1 Tax=Leptonema illini TaxID=183 RepID=UPI001C4DE939|nr:sodium:solute symporter family protein [Leptonema illini]